MRTANHHTARARPGGGLDDSVSGRRRGAVEAGLAAHGSGSRAAAGQPPSGVACRATDRAGSRHAYAALRRDA